MAKVTKEQIKVIYLPNQYDPKKFQEGCREVLELIALMKQREKF